MSTFNTARAVRSLLLILAALSWLVSCGGADSGGTGGGAVAVGPISGLGSIIVNGVRFDDRTAAIQDDEGAVRTRSDLQLGVFTEVEATGLTGSGGNQRATATHVRIRSEIIGPIDSVDPSTSILTVLGQTVLITPATAFDPGLTGGLAGLQTGAVVEVYGRFDAVRGRYAATRIEPRSNASFYKLRGLVASVDAATKTLTIGAQTISYAGLAVSDLPNIAVGNLVRATLMPASSAGIWNATALAVGIVRLPDSEDAQIEGRISSWTSSHQFSVDGIDVDASRASFPDGEAAVLLGARVEVEGSSSLGVLHARVVKAEGDEDANNSVFELHGSIETLDASTKTLTLRGVTVEYGGSVQYQGGSVIDLAVGRAIGVQGVLSNDGHRLVAQQISFESN